MKRRTITIGFAIILAILRSCQAHDDNRQEFVDAHNVFRKELGLPPICWDKEVAEFAKSYAQQRKDDCALIHSETPRKYGENLALGPGLNATGAVYFWASEKAAYDYNTNTCCQGKMCGHYTQVVWKDSVKLGCARVMCTNNPSCYVICNYDPPGNVINKKPY